MGSSNFPFDAGIPDTLTTSEVSKICRVSPQTVINWLDQGKLIYSRLGKGRRRIPVSEVMEFLKRNKHPLPDWMAALDTKAA